MLRRVVVTGLGSVTPLGISATETWDAILSGKCGITRLTDDSFQHLPSRIGGLIPPTFTPSKILSANEKRSANRTTECAISSASEALQHSGLDLSGGTALDRVGVCFGSSLAGFTEIVNTARGTDETQLRGYKRVSPFFVPRILDNMAASAISMRYGFLGPNHSAGTACTTGAHSIGDGYNLVRLGMADVMVVGSAEACVHPLAISGFCQAKALCTDSNETPVGASRPYDETRAGFVISEGGGVLVLEEMAYAQARCANILAEVVGYGMSADAHHITAPHPTGRGAFIAINGALGGTDPSRVSYVNAHATSTNLGDLIEGNVIRSIFSIDKQDTKGPYVSSTKGHIGHLLAGAGAAEAVVCIQSIVHQTVPHTLNLQNPCVKLNHVTAPIRDADIEYVLTNSFGFGGTNASLLFKRHDG